MEKEYSSPYIQHMPETQANHRRLSNFNLHVKLPTDCARINTLAIGTWNYAVWYKVSYKTNMQEYKTLAANLSSMNKYQYDLSAVSLGLQAGEYVTDLRFEFGTVPAGFAMTSKSAMSLYVLSTVYNGHKMISNTKQKRDAYSASFIRLKWFVSFHMRYLFINDRFKIWAIKKGPTFRMFFEKSAQNDQRDSSVPLGSLFCRIGIFLLQPQIVARKNPETVVVSGFSVSVSILVG